MIIEIAGTSQDFLYTRESNLNLLMLSLSMTSQGVELARRGMSGCCEGDIDIDMALYQD